MATELKMLPPDKTSLVRTDFTHRQAWDVLVAVVEHEHGDLDVTVIDDPIYRDVTPDELVGQLPADHPTGLILVADGDALTGEDTPLLVVDAHEADEEFPRVPPFRVALVEASSIEANVFTGNMDLEEFAAEVDDDGVFRGF